MTNVKRLTSAAIAEALEPRVLFNAPGWADTIDNPFMPMPVGATWLYRGKSNGDRVKERITILTETKQILGVACTISLDKVFTNGELTEKTDDYFAQDAQGNVWYLGEDSRDIESGKVVSTEGSFLSGENNANPGIVMQTHPAVGDIYQQESAPGVAEDMAENLTLRAKAATPFGTFTQCLETREFTPLEPDSVEVKYYQQGIGLVKSQAIKGDVEVFKLVQFVP